MIAQDRTEPTEIVEQHNFYTRQQRQGENTSTFVSELGTIAISCNFGEMYKKMLKDRLVCGVQDDRIERRLLVEIKLDFKKSTGDSNHNRSCIQECQRDLGETASQRSDSPSVNRILKRSGLAGDTCYRCGKVGHIKKACRTTQGTTHKSTTADQNKDNTG